jgi:outer membrane protein
MKTKILLLLVFFFPLLSVSAQTPDATPVRVWNLKQCVDHALGSNLTIQRSTLSVATSRVDLTQSRWNRYPTLNGSVNYGFNWGRSVDPVRYEYTTQELRSMNPTLNASVVLFNGFRVQNQVSQSSTAYQASEYDLSKTRNDVMVNITSLYINVIFNKEQMENARYQLASSQAQLERAKKQVAAGAIAKSEELNLDAQVATNEVNLVQRENQLNLSILQLKQALQLPATEPLDVEMIEIDVEDLVLDQTRDEVYEVARQTMPEIKSANTKVESADFAMRSARGGLYPRLSLFASLGTNYSSASDGPQFFPDGGMVLAGKKTVGLVEFTDQRVLTDNYVPTGELDENWGYRDQLNDNLQKTVGFSLTVPIFNNYQSRASYQKTVINRDLARISAKETENTLRQNVENAYNDAVAASKTYNASLRQVAAREEAFRMMTQRREAGAANAIEYQIAENDLYRAKSDLTRAKFDFIFRKKILDFYQGKPLEY